MGKRDDKRLKKVINLEFIIFSLVAIAVTMVLSPRLRASMPSWPLPA